jgi:hypothetical protein
VTVDEQANRDDAALGVVAATAGLGLAPARFIGPTPGLTPYLERAGAQGRLRGLHDFVAQGVVIA